MDAVSLITGAVGTLGGGLVWLLRLEGRVNSHERECAQRMLKLDERHAAIVKGLDMLTAKVDRGIDIALQIADRHHPPHPQV